MAEKYLPGKMMSLNGREVTAGKSEEFEWQRSICKKMVVLYDR